MVVQKSVRPFLAKTHIFFDHNNACKRHRLHAVYATLTHAYTVAYITAYTGATQRKMRRLYFITGHLGR